MNHVGLNLPEGHSAKTFLTEHYYAYNGVNMFFVISGFLITSILLGEKQQTGTVSVKRFYLKRVFRIFPIYYLFVSVVALLNEVLHWQIPAIVIGKSYLYLNNFGFWGMAYVLGHAWSLAVEEQYYLMWPFIVKKLSRPKYILFFCIGMSIISCAIRVLAYRWERGSHIITGNVLAQDLLTGFLKHADAIFIGAAFAIINKQYDIKTLISKQLAGIIALFAAVAYIGIEVLRSKFMLGVITVPFGNTVESSVCAILILYTIHYTSWVSWLLNTKLLSLIGLYSYSIYVWQQLFLIARNTFPGNTPPVMPQYWYTQFPLNIVLVFATAVISYHVIEKPFLQLRDRIISPRKKTKITSADTVAV